jgi:hypothetical protein
MVVASVAVVAALAVVAVAVVPAVGLPVHGVMAAAGNDALSP